MIAEAELYRIKTLFSEKFIIDEKTGNMMLKGNFNIPPFFMVYVEEGKFMMGDNKSEYKEEKPEHEVELSPFFMAQFPVTQNLYKAVSSDQPSEYTGDNRPVEQVTWYDAVNFCESLNKALKLENPFTGEKDDVTADLRSAGFRLPTEAEWEYAAREGSLGSRQKYSGSDDLDSVGWYNENCGYETKPVGLKLPNGLGLYDMSGNVWEWCLDWYKDDFYKKSPKKNPCNLSKGSLRVLRGGSFGGDRGHCRVSYRGSNVPGGGWLGGGFRLVLAF